MRRSARRRLPSSSTGSGFRLANRLRQLAGYVGVGVGDPEGVSLGETVGVGDCVGVGGGPPVCNRPGEPYFANEPGAGSWLTTCASPDDVSGLSVTWKPACWSVCTAWSTVMPTTFGTCTLPVDTVS